MVRDVLVGLAIFGLLWLGYKLSIVTVPILLAMALAYLFEPIVKRLTRSRDNGGGMSREAAASVIIAGAILLVLVPLSLGLVFAVGQGLQLAGRVVQVAEIGEPVVAALQRIGPPFDEEGEYIGFQGRLEQRLEADDLPAVPGLDVGGEEASDAEAAPPEAPDDEVVEGEAPAEGLTELAAAADDAWGELDTRFPILQDSLAWVVRTFGEDHGALGNVLGWAVAQVRANSEVILQAALPRGVAALQAVVERVVGLGAALFMIFLTGFFFFFFSTGYGKVLDFWRGLIPEAKKNRAVDLARQMDGVIAGFIRGRLTIAAIQAIFFTTAYWLIGVPAPLIIGPLVAILSIVPYVALIGVPITIILMLIDPPTGFQSAWWWTLGAPVVVYFAGQALDDYVLTPLIQGKSTDMDTPSILFASIAGGALAGLYGLLLAIPVAACLKILMREIFWPRFREWAEGKQRDFLPISGGESE